MLFYARILCYAEFVITELMSAGSLHKDKIGVMYLFSRPLRGVERQMSSVLAGAIRAGAHPALPRVGHKVAPFLSILLREPPSQSP